MNWPRIRVATLAVVLAYGTAVRSCDLEVAPLWTDEAESSINALSILLHGVPVGDYVGVPVFENVLIDPWPGHPEYEFRDTSYSASGLAVYHGWLPLYAIAASFAAHGIGPDVDDGRLRPLHDLEAMRLRTRAARFPSILFALLFMLGVYLAAKEIYGVDAGWAALAAACVSTTTVTLARQARYYSLTLALAAFTALLFARMYTRGRRRDFGLAGVTFVMLFHTNTLAFLSAWGAFMLLLPLLRRRGRPVRHLLMTAAIVAVGTVPWAVATGFIPAATVHAPARHLLEWRDVADYAAQRALFASLAAVTLMWYLVVHVLGNRLTRRIARPFAQARWGILFFFGWALVAFAAFTLLMPAASYFHSRLTLVILVPALLFGALLSAAVARTIAPNGSVPLAVALYVLLLASHGKTTFWWPDTPPRQPPVFQVVDSLRTIDIAPDTLIYADTGASLILRLYSGLPVRSVLPVRASFLQSHPGPVVIVESPRGESLSGPDVADALAWYGVERDPGEASRIARWFNDEIVRRELTARGAIAVPPAQLRGLPVDDLEFQALVHARDRKSEAAVAEFIAASGNPLFRGFRIRDYTELWQVFFYRFVGPESRMGERLNYAGRVSGADAFVLPGGWVVVRSGGPRAQPTAMTASTDQSGSEKTSPHAMPRTSP